jgi:formiminotetrahydrofolate cyclodeaminase
MDIGTQSINDFVASLASKQPTPGGGAVAGLLAALSTSLGQMVLAYTEGKKKYAEHEELHKEIIGILLKASTEALRLANADADAYEELNELWKLNKHDPKRVEAWDDALTNAIQVPLQIMRLSERILVALQTIKGKTNAMLVSDLIIAGILAESSARSARLNVAVNVNQMEESVAKNSLQAKAAALLASCISICASIEDDC